MSLPPGVFKTGIGPQPQTTTITTNNTTPNSAQLLAQAYGQVGQVGQAVNVMTSTPAQSFPQVEEKKRGIRKCETCYWYEAYETEPRVGKCMFKPPNLNFSPSGTHKVPYDWCSSWEPAKQSILSPKWQELIAPKEDTNGT